ncbi:uncharacterized protein LOC113233469 isoform X2 [Hyposmocoma kahamanoa]|uniref:uncharacterized protein LOC113233469 isoform X2 n=1 Tax=Hyposmocoma kahamanoa TaxID=1477025 RepID=UPI000E6D7BD0|nr:uncharacterized protein LOC113233469 isoform X2 [Hyposmocoma kahamanoa]
MFCREYLFVIGLIFRATSVSPIAEIDADNEVLHLIGEPDFRDVRLRWEYGQAEEEGRPRLLAFQVHYCELQAWGQYRCRTKVIDNPEEDKTARTLNGDASTTTVMPPGTRRGHTYSTRIKGLRMATTYSFEVRPVRRDARDLADPHSIGSKIIIVPTKGFSARATQCLPHASEVEVATGPFFGGRIAVEAADGGPERCSLQGNPNSAQDAYILRIHHEECGSEVNDTTVATYVIVQENLPILTHSTRRFLVLCTYKPETLTVRAGINLPKANPGDVLQHTKPNIGSVEPYDQDMDYNELQPARLEAQKEEIEQSVIGEVSLVMFLVVAAFGGLAFLIWKMVPQADRDNISIGTVSTLSRSSIFGSRNRDRFTDQSSIYSITLSEKDESFVKKPNEGDNTSEA